MKIFRILSFFFIYYIIQTISIIVNIVENDCTKLQNFLNSYGYGNSFLNNCCDEPGIKCNEFGDITYINISFGGQASMDFSTFPLFQSLKELTLKGDIFNNYLLPSEIFNLPSLEILDFSNSLIRAVTNIINSNSPITEIYLNNNDIQDFPYQFQNLKNLKILNLNNNYISGSLTNAITNFSSLTKLYLQNNNMAGDIEIPNSLIVFQGLNNGFNSIKTIFMEKYMLEEFHVYNNAFTNDVFDRLSCFSELKKLILGKNEQITTIRPSISKLTKLEEIDLSNLSITELPEDIFKLNLFSLNISNNFKLKAKIYNFQKKIDECDFRNTNIECYEPDTCNSVNYHKDMPTKKCIEEIINDDNPKFEFDKNI
eukprot:jgi/Orpsp1_1/1174206/evm.model.c7180000049269.1